VSLAPVPARPRRLVFLGTPDLAVPPLRALVAAGFDVALVVTRADKRRGRGGELSASPVKAAALELGLPVTHRVDDVLTVGADLGVVVAYGALIKPPVLAALAMVNVHFSLLPRWRGAAPIERAILAGDDETGVAVMQLEEGLDTGPVFACRRLPIEPGETALSLRARLVVAGTDLLVRTLTAGLRDPQPQAGEPTYAAKVGPADLELDWTAPAVALDRVVRVGDAWTTFRGRRLKVLAARPQPTALGADRLEPGQIEGDRVGTGDGELVLVTVQPEGRGSQPAPAWRNGARTAPGEAFAR
jgi:methionyl-tRNA formyltransferase